MYVGKEMKVKDVNFSVYSVIYLYDVQNIFQE